MTESVRSNRARTRNLLYVGILLLPISLNLINPSQVAYQYSFFGISFNVVFLLTAWFEHVVILNRFLDRRQYWAALLGSVGALFFFITVRYLIEQQLAPILINSVNYDPDGLTVWFYIQDNQYYAFTAVGLGILFKLIEDWFVHQQERRALVNEKTTAELAFLKSQINPHFLFNTLNNIYALAYTKSDAAPGAILKLSELMRYMLYESAGPALPTNGHTTATREGSHKVSLAKEIQYLRNLVDLEKLRVPNAQVQFDVEGSTDLYRIEPMLLISFVENAFKHGDLTDPNQPLVIQLSVRQGQLQADILNKKTTIRKTRRAALACPTFADAWICCIPTSTRCTSTKTNRPTRVGSC
ncbi:Sensor protein lytS [Fibrisoma limi BUZ 3]|uniref:Sensor protein lytS n=1 Tax=Fibrisoma limi BUZ 3 TaxID=1185876 RepID=I2GC39_9BACT|nr:sensor histidine kinase [Fibrisoma limi]CCH51463.1 Sensor protein lytS [Fibrisoma limi BUZ 3]